MWRKLTGPRGGVWDEGFCCWGAAENWTVTAFRPRAELETRYGNSHRHKQSVAPEDVVTCAAETRWDQRKGPTGVTGSRRAVGGKGGQKKKLAR